MMPRFRPLAGAMLVCPVTCIILVAASCTGPQEPTRLNAPPQGDASKHTRLSQYFGYHNDQGMLADMSIADVHFVGHSADLSGSGEARLERYAELLASSGGTIHYDTMLRDEGLIKARLAAAGAFLEQALPRAKTIALVVGLPGGRGMVAKEASAAKAIAKQPEPRKTAYKLNVSGASSRGG